jgi:cytochrome P450
LTSDGDFWLRQRRLAQPAFHRQRIAAYGEVMTGFTERTLAQWRNGEVRDIHEEMMKLTLDVVAKTLFDQEESAQIADIGTALDAIMARFDNNSYLSMIENVVQRPLLTPIQRRYQQAVQRLDAIVRGVIAQRRAQNEDKGDLLGMFLAARDEDGNGMSDQQLLDECKTMCSWPVTRLRPWRSHGRSGCSIATRRPKQNCKLNWRRCWLVAHRHWLIYPTCPTPNASS